jgi:hypothetical protein
MKSFILVCLDWKVEMRSKSAKKKNEPFGLDESSQEFVLIVSGAFWGVLTVFFFIMIAPSWLKVIAGLLLCGLFLIGWFYALYRIVTYKYYKNKTYFGDDEINRDEALGILEGLEDVRQGRVFSIETLWEEFDKENGFQSDKNAMRSDWKNVGNDLWKAIQGKNEDTP